MACGSAGDWFAVKNAMRHRTSVRVLDTVLLDTIDPPAACSRELNDVANRVLHVAREDLGVTATVDKGAIAKGCGHERVFLAAAAAKPSLPVSKPRASLRRSQTRIRKD